MIALTGLRFGNTGFARRMKAWRLAGANCKRM